DVAQPVGVVGDEPVDAPVEKAAHVRGGVDGPRDDLDAEVVGGAHRGFVDVVEVRCPGASAGGLDHVRDGRVVGEIHPAGPARIGDVAAALALRRQIDGSDLRLEAL